MAGNVGRLSGGEGRGNTNPSYAVPTHRRARARADLSTLQRVADMRTGRHSGVPSGVSRSGERWLLGDLKRDQVSVCDAAGERVVLLAQLHDL